MEMDKSILQPLIELVQTEISPHTLAQDLQDIDWEYSQYAIKDPDLCGAMPEIADRRYRLRQLREALQNMADQIQA